MSRGTWVAVLVAAAVLCQAAVVNRLPLPWGIAPDLVVAVVVGAGLAVGPRGGCVAGFAAGLALDVLPPTDGELGRQALLMCLVGYLAGRARHGASRSPWLPFGIVAVGVLVAGLGDALLGLTVSDPGVSAAGLLRTLPVALVSTLLLSPFVLYGMGLVLGTGRTDDAPFIGRDPRGLGRRP